MSWVLLSSKVNQNLSAMVLMPFPLGSIEERYWEAEGPCFLNRRIFLFPPLISPSPFYVLSGYGSVLSLLVIGYKGVLKIISGGETVRSSESTSGTLFSMCLISPFLYLPAECGSHSGQGLPLALLVRVRKFLMEDWGCSTNQNSLCLATFSYCQHNSLERAVVEKQWAKY